MTHFDNSIQSNLLGKYTDNYHQKPGMSLGFHMG